MAGAIAARADVTLLLEEPYGSFGGMNPTGHAAVFLSRVCAETPLVLRPCNPGEQGVVISRYHRVGGYDWVGIPLIAYLYAVERADQVPESANPEEVASLRDRYRRSHLEEIVPDQEDGNTPHGDWTQLVGEAYDRTIYTFGIESTADQDARFIALFNARSNHVHFHLLSSNCADFARQVIDFYYPKSVRRNFSGDLGIMTPIQTAKCLVRYSQKHPQLQFSSFVIAQSPGTVPRSSPVRGVLESLVKSKRYLLTLGPLAVLHPVIGGGLAYSWLERPRFDPRKVVTSEGGFPLAPAEVDDELSANGTR